MMVDVNLKLINPSALLGVFRYVVTVNLREITIRKSIIEII